RECSANSLKVRSALRTKSQSGHVLLTTAWAKDWWNVHDNPRSIRSRRKYTAQIAARLIVVARECRWLTHELAGRYTRIRHISMIGTTNVISKRAARSAAWFLGLVLVATAAPSPALTSNGPHPGPGERREVLL